MRYGDFTVEGNIHKILSLKKNYEKSLNEKLNLDNILKDLKKNSVIHERYEIIDFLLKKEIIYSKVNNFSKTSLICIICTMFGLFFQTLVKNCIVKKKMNIAHSYFCREQIRNCLVFHQPLYSDYW